MVFYWHDHRAHVMKSDARLEGKPMKSHFLAILAFLLTTLLLTACPPTPPRTEVPQVVQITQILEEDFATPTPHASVALRQEINYSMYQPGTVFSFNEDGTLTNIRIVPELSQPEWDAQDFPKGFSTTLHAGHWKKFRLGPASVERGFLVDVTPSEASTEGAEIVSQVMPEYDGESWGDVLWLLQPKEAPPLPVYVKVYTTEGWSIVFHDRLNLKPGVWQGYTICQASEYGGYVVEVSPQGEGVRGDTLQRFMINPEFPGGWHNVLRIQIPQSQAPMQADVAIYRTPLDLIKAETTQLLQPGQWYAAILGPSEEQAAYVMEVTPLSKYDDQVESYSVQPVFMDGTWMDVFRVKIPSDRKPMHVMMRVHAAGPESRTGAVGQVPTPTRPAILPSATPTPLPTATNQAGCPGALPSRLQVGRTGVVSLDPPIANRVRREPDRNAEVLGQIMPGEKFIVLEGPRCADGWAWWRVRSRTQDLEGWSSEGDETTYWLLPATTPTSTSTQQPSVTPKPTSTPTFDTGVQGCVEPPAGLIGWWPAEGDTHDIVGVNDGALLDGVTFADGMAGQAFSFDGNSYVSAPTTDLPTSDDARTLEFWVKVNTFADIETYFAGYGKFLSFEQTYHLGATGSTLFFSQWGQAILGPALQTGRWYHVAATNVGTSVTLYLDGAVVARGNLPMNTPGDTQLYIGRLPVDPGKRLDGLIDEVGVYDRALSTTEIQAIFLAGSKGKCKPEPRATLTPSPTKTAKLPSVTPTPWKPRITFTPFPTSTPVITGTGSRSPRAASFPLHLIGNAWSGIFLGETNYPWGYLVDVTPLQPSVDGAHIETYIQTWFDGTQWVDYAFVGLPVLGASLDVQVDIYITQDWPVAYQGKMSLPAAEWRQFYLDEVSKNAAYVLDVNPLEPSVNAVAIIPSVVLPEFSDGVWWDMERMALYSVPQRLEAQVTAYQAPDLPMSTFHLHLEPGTWHGVSLGPASQEQAYLVEVDPISPGQEGYHLEKVTVQPEFNGTTWNDVLRVMIPQDQPAQDVVVRVYTLKP
jgi:hypothetical protein